MNAENAGIWSAEEISEGGERVSHLHKDWAFYGHLSIYDFATQFCKDAYVLDVGSGAGYGTPCLADAGAHYVIGIDSNEKAVAFSKYHFKRPNLEFQEMSAEKMHDLPPRHFDFIYTSNTLEHVADIPGFLRIAWSLLKPTGALLVAVPPITDERLQYLNIINPHCLNVWSPRQWYSVLDRFFGDITPYLHGVEKIGAFLRPEHMTTGSTLTEKSFVFAPATVDDMYSVFTVTAIFVARGPRTESALPSKNYQLEFVDESFTRPHGYIDPEIRKRLGKYFEEAEETSMRKLLRSAITMLHTRRSLAMLIETARFVSKKLSIR